MHQFIVIRRPDDPEDEACHAYKRVFPDVEKAKEFAKRAAAREQEDLDGIIISFEREVVLDGPRCGKRVKDSDVGDYRWQCPECDEDFYDFECAPSEEK